MEVVKRPYPPLFVSLIYQGYREKEYFKGILARQFVSVNYAFVDSVFYYTKEDVKISGSLAFESWKNKNLFSHVKSEFKKRADTLIKAAKKDIPSFFEAYARYMPALFLVWPVESIIESKLKHALLKKLPSEKVSELMAELNTPLEDNFARKEEFDLVKTKNLEKHIKEYEWILARYGDERKYTLKEAQEKLKHINKAGFLKRWKQDKQKLGETIAYAKKLLGKDSYLVDIFQYIIYYRTQRTDVMNKSAFIAIPLLKKKAGSLGLTYNEILYCSALEILDNKIPSKETIRMRMKDSSVLLEDGNIRVLAGKESEKLKEFFREEYAETSEIKGSVACKGIVKGKAKIIISRDDFSRLQHGDILVASMTTPEMMPILKKASAIVTDEGGITCHAAIISREMKKPCIIGTKIATKVLKDGDLVEVDADKGIVRKI
jgi:phosphohistidine swiveling domain-containing protein